ISGLAVTSQGSTSSPGVFRYTVAASGLKSGDHLTATYVAGTWSYNLGGTPDPAVVAASSVLALHDGSFIDVRFNSAGGVPLDPASITDSGAGNDEFMLGGSGLGTGPTLVQLDQTQAPSILADGQTVRYYVTGQFVAGLVTVP